MKDSEIKEKKTAQRINNPSSPRLLPLKKAAEYLGLTIWSLREQYWKGHIPAFTLPGGGRKLFFRVADLERFIEINTRKFA